MGIRSPSLYAAFGSKEALWLEAADHYVKTVGPMVWDRLEAAATAREGVEELLLAGTETLPEAATPAGCMAMLAAVSDEWPAPIADAARNLRFEMLGRLQVRVQSAIQSGEIPGTANADRLARFYFSVFEGMAIQARDGATPEDLKGVVESAMLAWPEP
jgi:AcrR family transcriptional regulator